MQRLEDGKFAKGNKGGPGRPKKEREQRFYEIAISTVTFKDWGLIIKKAVEQAKRGDSTARKFLADYLMGTPQQKLDITTNDESLNVIEITGVDYRTAITNLAPRPMGDSEPSSEGESAFDGQEMG